MHVVTVTFTINPGERERFLPLILENARKSLELEPGCQRFDVCEHPEIPEEIYLYEVYDDPAAFDMHRTMPHYLEFTQATDAMIATKTVRLFTLIPD